MKQILYLFLGLFALAACHQHELDTDGCVLELELSKAHVPVVATRAIDADLTVVIYDAEGKVYKRFFAGEVPNEIPMRAGTFTLCVYTDNQEIWHKANEGRGEPCYYVSEAVTLQFGARAYLSLSVPMTNYAVGVELPELFDELFSSYQFTLQDAYRNISISDGEEAYFDVTDEGFTYTLSTTNIDGVNNAHDPVAVTSVQSGKKYLVSYNYDAAAVASRVDRY